MRAFAQQIQQMNLEVRSLDPATRKQLSKKVDTYKANLKSVEIDFQRVREKEERAGLLGAAAGGRGVRAVPPLSSAHAPLCSREASAMPSAHARFLYLSRSAANKCPCAHRARLRTTARGCRTQRTRTYTHLSLRLSE